MANVIVDTYKLNQYAQRIATVNSRINRLDQRLDGLYRQVGLLDLWDLVQADALAGYSWRLLRCQNYLQQTASDFDSAEKQILAKDPNDFLTVGNGGLIAEVIQQNPWFDPQHTGTNMSGPEAAIAAFLGWLTSGQITEIPSDLESTGDTLAWLEEVYGAMPHWATHGFEVVIPDSLKQAYTLTSGLIQGDLTFEEGWDIAKDILSENTKLAVICETLDYTFKTGAERNAEMEKQIYAQLAEGDILGAVFDGAEGFVDTIIGGTIDVLGDVGGGAVDDLMDKTVVTKGINMVVEYGTGLLGWNDGDGYSVGGLIGETTEKLSEGLDAVTDVITDVTDVVTDVVTDGVKSGVRWVKSWFD